MFVPAHCPKTDHDSDFGIGSDAASPGDGLDWHVEQQRQLRIHVFCLDGFMYVSSFDGVHVN